MAKKERPAADAEGGAARPRSTRDELALASLRTANRSMREVSNPEVRARIMLAEANVLALLDLADAIRSSSPNGQR